MPGREIIPWSARYDQYLCDESGYCGYAESISFPETAADLVGTVTGLKRAGTLVTIQGGRTGIVGGAVPHGGHILNLSRMKAVLGISFLEDGRPCIRVQPGITRLELAEAICRNRKLRGYFWAPDPTEPSATIGGIAASGAQGLSTGLYGRTERHIREIRCMNSRGEVFSDMALFGSEGHYGPITELELALTPKPNVQWGIVCFFPEECTAGSFAEAVRKGTASLLRGLAVCEYIDRRSIDLVEQRKASMTAIRSLPDVDPEVAAMIYLELHGADEEGVAGNAEMLMEALLDCGGDPERTWALLGEKELERMRAYRHAIPESVNLMVRERSRGDAGIIKVATDMSIPVLSFTELISLYREVLSASSIDAAIFGHVLENHLHINLLPESSDAMDGCYALVWKLAEACNRLSGSVVSEHGAGRLRKDILRAFPPVGYREHRRQLQRYAVPDDIWEEGVW